MAKVKYADLVVDPATPVGLRRTALTQAMVVEPMELLRLMLDRHPGSSLSIARDSGVPGSVVRAIRNGGVRDVKTDTWGQLLWWLLRTEAAYASLVRKDLPKYVAPGERAA